MTDRIPDALARALVEGPSVLSGVEWHDEVDSTNRVAAAAAGRGVPEVHAVLADRQTAGRGRLGRSWQAPPGTSLLLSFVVRPRVATDALPRLALVTGVALAETVAAHLPACDVALKWPNDLLVDGAKTAGILVESLPAGAPPHAAAVVGVGVNVDWRGVARPASLAGATSLAEAGGTGVDRWRLLAGFVGVFGNRYTGWRADSGAFLDAYRARCATIGQPVRVATAGGAVEGLAVGVADSGALRVRTAADDVVDVAAGDVRHVRAATR